MNLFKAVVQMKNEPSNENIAQAICDCIEDRQGFYEEREPESEGTVYERWEETCDAWNEIVDMAQELVDAVDTYKDEIDCYDEYVDEEEPASDDVESIVASLLQSLNDFQAEYGGISRLKIEC